MSVPFAWRSTFGSRCRLAGLLCLLAFLPQAEFVATAPTQEEARESTIALLWRIQNESGRAAVYLPRAFTQIQQGLVQTMGDPLQHGQWLVALWIYHLLNDDHANARKALEESLQQLTIANASPELLADVTAKLSYSLILLGEVAKAKEYLRRAIVLGSQQSNRGLLADFYYAIGDAYRKTGERMIARRYFEAALEIDAATGNASAASVSELKLGSLARDAGDPADAARRHLLALAQFDKEGKYWQVVTRIELARDYVALKELNVATSFAEAALADQRAMPEQTLDACIVLLRILNDRRSRGEDTAGQSRHLISRIEALLEESAIRQKSEFARPTHQLQFATQAIRHYAMDRDLGRVNATGRAAIRLARSVANNLRATNDDSLAWLTGAQPVLNEYVKALYALDREQVFPLLEAYYDQPADAAATRHAGVVGRAFETQELELFERYRAAERALVDANVELTRLQSHAGSTARAAYGKMQLDQRLRERDFARDDYLAIYHAQPMAQLPAAPEAIQVWQRPPLAAGDAVIRYFIQEEVSFGVALAGKEIEYFDLPARSEVVKLVRAALNALQTAGDNNIERASLSRLTKLLPGEFLQRHPETTRLIIVPDDAVQPLPFAAIDTGEPAKNYEPLIERFEVLRTKSATRYYATQHHDGPSRDTATADIVVLADPIVGGATPERFASLVRSWGDGLASLPSTRTEAASIVRTFATHTVQTYLGAAATSDVLLSPEVRAAKILHIATHGYFSSTAPDIVGLATSGSSSEGSQAGFLGLTELFNEPFSSRLVVISGCETMRGEDFSGWGVRSMADGFLTQGAGSVVGTLWSVSDAATAELMDAFYRNLSANAGNSSAALRAAQLELIRSRRFSDAHYWAGIVLESTNRSVDQRTL